MQKKIKTKNSLGAREQKGVCPRWAQNLDFEEIFLLILASHQLLHIFLHGLGTKKTWFVFILINSKRRLESVAVIKKAGGTS